MLAPSPDWVLAFKDLDLCDNDVWLASKTVKLVGIDAGDKTGDSWALSTTDENSTIKRGIDLDVDTTGLTLESGRIVREFGSVTITQGIKRLLGAIGSIYLFLQ